MKKTYLMLLSSLIFITMSTQANALIFSRIGEIKRVFSDNTNFGGCMIELNVNIGEAGVNDCPINGYVSLDCDAIHSAPGDGTRHFAAALVAGALGKTVGIYSIDDTKKINSYCTAGRIDVILIE